MNHEIRKLNALLTIAEKLELILIEMRQLNQEMKGKEIIDKVVSANDYSITLNPLFRDKFMQVRNAVEEQDEHIKVIDNDIDVDVDDEEIELDDEEIE